ncbi:hypothetical protein HDU97_006258 [Phlyctochytrium planicorne]|nr:hypothetical protein HDU97_006258 [Phlyctochytrium planicorne]
MAAITSTNVTLPTTTVSAISPSLTSTPLPAPSKCVSQLPSIVSSPANCAITGLMNITVNTIGVQSVESEYFYYTMSNYLKDSEINSLLQARTNSTLGDGPRCDDISWSGLGEDGRGWFELKAANRTLTNSSSTVTTSTTPKCIPQVIYSNVTSAPPNCFLGPEELAISNGAFLDINKKSYVITMSNLTDGELKNLIRTRVSTIASDVRCDSIKWVNAGELGQGSLELMPIPTTTNPGSNPKNNGAAGVKASLGVFAKLAFVGMAAAVLL